MIVAWFVFFLFPFSFFLPMPALHLATFSCDVTPPDGHPLCGGWILPVRGVDDPLRALGVVLLGMGRPVVLCVVDWTGIRNEAFRVWRAALAEAAHTTPEHVSLHTVHPHNAPFADVEAEKLIAAAGAAKSAMNRPITSCRRKPNPSLLPLSSCQRRASVVVRCARMVAAWT